jgi:hypothetical protein
LKNGVFIHRSFIFLALPTFYATHRNYEFFQDQWSLMQIQIGKNKCPVSTTYCFYLEGEVVVQHVLVPGEELHHVVGQLRLGPVTLAPASFRQLQSCNN